MKKAFGTPPSLDLEIQSQNWHPKEKKTVFYWFSLITVPCFPCFKGEEKGREEINGHQLNNASQSVLHSTFNYQGNTVYSAAINDRQLITVKGSPANDYLHNILCLSVCSALIDSF